ncbi:MAG: type II secretion system F family protein [Promicromonosporaceae bacterium]|nr:type II secretion system F family protein [Promicromonosporaceae bacterium]
MRGVGLIVSGTMLGLSIAWLVIALRPQRDDGDQVVRRHGRLSRVTRQTWILLGVGVVGGVVTWLITGWLIALVVVPVGAVGLPLLLTNAAAGAQITRLEAMEEWTRSLAGVLTVGVGLEQALGSTLRSVPPAIAPEVRRLVARLRARGNTEEALRAFADELDDATGDLVAANLILGARRRGAGLASVLQALAESVAADVRARRQIEADRAKPRSTARWVTIISTGVLVVFTLSGRYVAPYATPIGQVILVVLVSAYIATLLWMKRMATGKPAPRFLVGTAR